jgi:hypothetical protein
MSRAARPCTYALARTASRLPVSAGDGDEQQQAPQREGPAGDPVGPPANALDGAAHGPTAAWSNTLGCHATALDALAHTVTLDFGPPRAGLRSHSHRQRC